MSEKHEEIALLEARRQAIKDGWNKYRFFGEPPTPGTPVEQRLIETCERYVTYAVSEKLRGKAVASKPMQDGSESEQRVLHNQLAMMTVGDTRTGLDLKAATRIKEYAFSIARPGFSVDEIYAMEIEK
ncbi:MAG: hypothetical protein ACNFW9_03295 [Candidatus Kerfeldbacteria bacterium]|jgi:hypothetical protein